MVNKGSAAKTEYSQILLCFPRICMLSRDRLVIKMTRTHALLGCFVGLVSPTDRDIYCSLPRGAERAHGEGERSGHTCGSIRGERLIFQGNTGMA